MVAVAYESHLNVKCVFFISFNVSQFHPWKDPIEQQATVFQFCYENLHLNQNAYKRIHDLFDKKIGSTEDTKILV